MRHLRLRISDLANVTGYSRFQIRGLLTEVFRDPPIGRKVGAQQTFSAHELLVVAVACEMEEKFGISRKRLAVVSQGLRKILRGPREANRDARLLVAFDPPVVKYLEHGIGITEGLVLRLGPQFERVDEYLGVSGVHFDDTHDLLPLHAASATVRGQLRKR